MKKLYIPTTTLNFNNIMAGESISPRSFYRERGYGYRTWYTLSDNDLVNSFALFDRPFSFSRPYSDLEDHPLLIEVQLEENLPERQEGVFMCDHTIYLSPWRTKFILFNDADKRRMLSMQEGSLETKMVGLYSKKGIVVEQHEARTMPLGIEDMPLNSKLLEHDVQINKLKGLLYGYYIGAMLSVPEELTYKYKRLQELNDIFSSVASSAAKRPTEHQKAILDTIFREENKVVPLINDWAAIEGMTEPMLDEVIKLALNHHVKLPGYLVADDFIASITSSDNSSWPFSWLKQRFDELKGNIRRSGKKIDVRDEEIIVSDGKLSKIKAAKNETLVKAWINEVMMKKEYNGEIQLFNELLSDELTRIAKDVYGSEWDDSTLRIKLNQMRRFIVGQENIEDWSNGDVSSAAAVLLKGSEWDKLLDFIRRKGMSDCRLTFAFYGMLHGFANLTRDFTDILFGNDNRYIADVIREINGQLLGDDLASVTNKESYKEEIKPSAPLSPESVPIYSDQSIDAVKENGTAPNCNVFMETLKTKSGSNSKLYKGFEKENFDNITMDDEKTFRAEVFRIAMPIINSYKTDKEKRKRQLEEAINAALGRRNVPRQKNLFESSTIPRSFLEDKSWIYDTAEIITDHKAKKQYIEDAEWFVDNHKETYFDKKKREVQGIYKDKDKTNEKVILRFEKYLDNKVHNENQKWLQKLYRDIPIDKIISRIKEMYNA